MLGVQMQELVILARSTAAIVMATTGLTKIPRLKEMTEEDLARAIMNLRI